MTIGLQPGVTFCEVGERIIFLDIRADRYFGLGTTAEAAFRRSVAGPPVTEDDPATARLLASGLLVNGAPSAPRACVIPAVASESLLDLDRPATGMPSLLGACGALIRAHLALRWIGLAAALDGVTAHRARQRPVGRASERLSEVAAAFDLTTRLTRSHDRCLVRSIAIMHRLASLGVVAELVIGVRLRPFAAHSWVQQGPRLVSDRLDQVRSYTPILVL